MYDNLYLFKIYLWMIFCLLKLMINRMIAFFEGDCGWIELFFLSSMHKQVLQIVYMSAISKERER